MSKMSRQEFQLIASVIASLSDAGTDMMTALGPRQLSATAEAFADALAETNPAFDRALFIQAATGVVPVNARKAQPRTLASDLAEDR